MMSLFFTKNPTFSWILSLFFIVTGWQLFFASGKLRESGCGFNRAWHAK